MSATTGRVLSGIVVAVCLLGIGGLEMVTERVHPIGVGVRTSPAHLADSEIWEEPGPSPSQLTASVQAERQTVLNVDPAARQFLSLTGTGQVLLSEVSKAAVVVTENEQSTNEQSTGLALLRPGDVISVEATHGQVQRIVVLRNGRVDEERADQ
ncbi:MAG: hypothetical protein ACRELW_12400 [Candidatus Rokuibacteriota bacterium]